MYFLYSTLVVLAALAALPWLALSWLLGRKRHRLERLNERLGFVPPSSAQRPAPIWFHCVSVGEVMATRGLIREMAARFPERPLVVSTVTRTGRDIARRDIADQATLFYLPLDHSWALNRAFRRLRPALLVIIETEIWPNLFRIAAKHGTAVALVNGRISDRSFPRYRRFRGFLRRVLATVNVAVMQSHEDASRLIELGIDPDKVHCLPNLKWQVIEPPADRNAAYWRHTLLLPESRKVFVAGSTCAGEEELILDAVREARKLFPDLVTVIAPRKPDRFREVEEILSRRNLSSAVRSREAKEADFILLDTIGELSSLYAIADVVFVGGSLVDAGGHNILEPAMCARPVLFGPFMSNFREMSRLLTEHSAGRQVADRDELAQWVIRLLANPQEADRMGGAGRRLVESLSDTVGKTATILTAWLGDRP